ncbi:MAG: response regulator [Synechococcales cyanobacterium RU_4_20]|nr:response regulator [Synechococcales cyanobacterium RU_4_20]NJR67781.1 response regulator [Synechococcales cyanobacterium CRU_2_2]
MSNNLPVSASVPASVQARVPASDPAPAVSPAAPTALVVDDSRAEQRLIAALLAQMGMTVAAVDSGESALVWLAHQTPDVLVIDVVMPGMSGFDLCRQLRARPETAQVPVIFCTSKDQDFDRFWGLRQGGSVYLTKPFAPQDLIAAVTSCLA